MVKYFKSNQVGNQYADLLKGSEIMYNISRPPSAPNKNTDVTLYQWGIHEHPVNSGDWIACVGDEDVRIHPIVKSQSQGAPQIPGWQAFFGGQDGQDKKAIIAGNTTGVLNSQDFVKSQWTEHTNQELVNDGWFI